MIYKGASFSGVDHEVVEKGLFSKAGKTAMENWGRMAEGVSRNAASGFYGSKEAGISRLQDIARTRPEISQSGLKRVLSKVARKPKIG